MLTFFRRIRQRLLGQAWSDTVRKGLLGEGNVPKYLLYAIGEILLVMIGILLALQVNNWNTERIERGKVVDYANSLIEDLEQNKSTAIYRKSTMDRAIIRIDSLMRSVRNKRIEEISNLDLFCLSRSLRYPPFSWNRSTIQELQSSGGYRMIKNDSLLNAIVTYDAFTIHLDEDYEKDLNLATKIHDQISNVVNTNYPNIDELDELLNLNLHEDESFSFFSSDTYLEARSTKLELLEHDINEIHKTINNMISHRRALKIRTIEMSRMIDDSDNIRNLLNQLYRQ